MRANNLCKQSLEAEKRGLPLSGQKSVKRVSDHCLTVNALVLQVVHLLSRTTVCHGRELEPRSRGLRAIGGSNAVQGVSIHITQLTASPIVQGTSAGKTLLIEAQLSTGGDRLHIRHFFPKEILKMLLIKVLFITRVGEMVARNVLQCPRSTVALVFFVCVCGVPVWPNCKLAFSILLS